MFKSKEDLIKENEDSWWDDVKGGYENGLKMGINEAFSSIAERKKFYETYSHNSRISDNSYEIHLSCMQEEIPEVFHEFAMQTDKHWNEWLYHFCFDGVK